MGKSIRAGTIGVVGCNVCGLVLAPDVAVRTDGCCPRCQASLRTRGPHWMMSVWIPLVLGMTCYVPALILPIMSFHSIGQMGGPSTILSGIADLWNDGSHAIAVLIFFASVVVPCMKFIALISLLVSAHRKSSSLRRFRSLIHRLIEAFGYWSMLDVVVVGLLVSLVQFQGVASIDPGPAVVFFSLSVIFTMFASHAFDPRRIWDHDSCQ